jgi:N-methylhydantoinase A
LIAALDDAAIKGVFELFHAAHEAEYGHAFRASAIEIVNIRVTAVASGPKIGRPAPKPDGSLEKALVRKGRCLFRVKGELGAYDTPFYQRDLLPLDQPIPGPAIVLQEDSTTVVPPECTFVAEHTGNLFIRIGGVS